MKVLLLFFLLLAPLALFTQNAKIDSLKRVIETTKVDSTKGRALCRLCDSYRDLSDTAASYKYGEEGVAACKRAKDLEGEASCHTSIARTHFETGQFAKALERFQRTLKINKDLSMDRGVANAQANIGNVYYYLGNYQEAIEHHEKAITGGQAVGDLIIVRMGLNGLGASYLALGNMPKALESFQEAVRIQERTGGNDLQMATAMQNVCALHLMMEDYAKSLECFRKCQKTFKKHNTKDQEAVTLNNMGGCYEKLGDLDKAREHYQQSLDIREQIGDQHGITSCLSNLGNVFALQGEYAKAMEYHNRSLAIDEKIGNQAGVASGLTNISGLQFKIGKFGAAQESARKGLAKAAAIGNVEYQRDAAKSLYRADSALGDWKSAFEAHRLFKIYADSLKNDDQSKEIGRLEAQFTAAKEREILESRQRNEIERYNWVIGSSVGGLLLMMLLALTFLRGRQKEKRANAELRVLNDQIGHQKTEIEAQNLEINAINAELQATLDRVNQQHAQLEAQHAKIEDSIRYASRIQRSILPSAAQLHECLPPHFIHYQPRDIVSGDFYWMTKQGGRTYFASVDCTGHGVPGAFMSVLGSNLLHQIVDESQVSDPGMILAELDRRITATLRQQFGGDSKDGMDLALIVLHEADKIGKRTVEYAGAGRPLWVWSNGIISEYKSANTISN